MKKIIALSSLFLIVSGCSIQYDDGKSRISYDAKDIARTQYEEWTNVENGLEVKQFLVGEQNIITVLKVNPESFNWAIAQDTANTKMVSFWREELGAKVVINGSYFDENNQSTGYLLIDGEEYGNLSTAGQNGYTGMLSIADGKPSLRYLPKQNYKNNENIDFALQTFPTLIYNGQSLVETESGKTARRTVLAQGKDGNFYIFISEFFISLYELSKWLESSEIQPQTAINLDGGPSTGLVVKNKDFYYKADSAPVPNVIYLKK